MQLQNFYGNVTDLITQKAEEKIKNKMNDVLKEIEKQIPAKMQLIRAEIFGIYTTIVNRTFITVFNEYYGVNYDINSLLNSINYNNGNGIIPDFSYDENKFIFNQELLNPDINNRYNRFNKNAGLTDEFVRFNDPRLGRNSARYYSSEIAKEFKEIYNQSMENLDNYEMGNENISQEELDESLDYIDYVDNTRGKTARTMTRDEGYKGLTEVYKIARQRALYEFQIEFHSQIKPRILNKYGINI